MKYKGSVILVLLFLLTCAFSYFVSSPKFETGENRTLATFYMVFHPVTNSVVYYDSPVERLDMALSDQFPLREIVIKKYLKLINTSENMIYRIVKVFSKEQENQYFLHPVGTFELIEDTGYITTCPSTSLMDTNVVQRRVDQLNRIHEDYPDLNMYVYYVSQAFDMPWFNNYLGTTAADHYKEIVEALPRYVRSDHLLYENLDDYMNIHYKTDHHWNHYGSRRGYEDIYVLMSEDFELGEIRIPIKENRVSDKYDFVYIGSYGRALKGLLDSSYDEFAFYTYDLPQRKVAILNPETLEEIPVKNIGLYDEYQKGEINKDIKTDHYIALYGNAKDKDGIEYSDDIYPFVVRNSEVNGKNLLLTGDSYSRAIRDVLASHFGVTVYLDYRTLSKIPIDYIIDEYNIDVLLISSNTSMWESEEYLFTFKGDK